jgi:hypothetical protein
VNPLFVIKIFIILKWVIEIKVVEVDYQIVFRRFCQDHEVSQFFADLQHGLNRKRMWGEAIVDVSVLPVGSEETHADMRKPCPFAVHNAVITPFH